MVVKRHLSFSQRVGFKSTLTQGLKGQVLKKQFSLLFSNNKKISFAGLTILSS